MQIHSEHAPTAFTALVLAAGALALTGCGSRTEAIGNVDAPAKEATAIKRAVLASACLPRHRCRVGRIRIASSNSSYADAGIIDPKFGVAAWAVLHRDGGDWKVIDLGISAVGCGVVADQVKRDLLLGCPGVKRTGRPAPRPIYTNANWRRVVANPDWHKGARASFYGRIRAIRQESTGTYFWIFANLEKSQSTIVTVPDTTTSLYQDDFVKVVGQIKGLFRGQAIFGVKFRGPLVAASRVKRVPPLSVRSTPNNASFANPFVEADVVFDPWKLEWAQDETRVFMRVTNKSSSPLSIFPDEAHLTVSGRTYDTAFSDRRYPQLAVTLRPKATTSGVIVFAPMKVNFNNMKLTFSVRSFDTSVGDNGNLEVSWTWHGR